MRCLITNQPNPNVHPSHYINVSFEICRVTPFIHTKLNWILEREMSFLAGRLAGKEGAYFFQETKQAVGRLAQKKSTQKPSSLSGPSSSQEEAKADVLPEVLRHSLPAKIYYQPLNSSSSSSSSISTSKWVLQSDPNNASSSSAKALNPLRDYLSMPQVTLGPKRSSLSLSLSLSLPVLVSFGSWEYVCKRK